MARKSILVVDDEKSQREILEVILSGEGYNVTTASSGEAAMKFVADRHFDLVLTDFQMGGMTGLDLLKDRSQFWVGLQVGVANEGPFKGGTECVGSKESGIEGAARGSQIVTLGIRQLRWLSRRPVQPPDASAATEDQNGQTAADRGNNQ